jgi:phosphonate transport system permease protein
MTAKLVPDFEVYHYRNLHPRLFGRPLAEQLRIGAIGFAFTVFTLYTFWALGFFDFAMIGRGLIKLGDVIGFMLPPRHNGWFGEFALGIAETLAMAFIGTLIAALGALPLGFLGAKNVIPNWVFHFGLRRVFDGLRGIDTLIWALIFVNVVGLGPFAGILAIGFGDMPVLAKLFAEAIENIDTKPVEGVKAAGGGRLEVVRLGMFPQVFPVILSQSLYYFESNTRSATILGIVGAGGIGLQLSDRIRVNNWDEASFIILMILGTVYVIDILSRHLRRRFIGVETYRP